MNTAYAVGTPLAAQGMVLVRMLLHAWLPRSPEDQLSSLLPTVPKSHILYFAGWLHTMSFTLHAVLILVCDSQCAFCTHNSFVPSPPNPCKSLPCCTAVPHPTTHVLHTMRCLQDVSFVHLCYTKIWDLYLARKDVPVSQVLVSVV